MKNRIGLIMALLLVLSLGAPLIASAQLAAVLERSLRASRRLRWFRERLRRVAPVAYWMTGRHALDWSVGKICCCARRSALDVRRV